MSVVSVDREETHANRSSGSSVPESRAPERVAAHERAVAETLQRQIRLESKALCTCATHVEKFLCLRRAQQSNNERQSAPGEAERPGHHRAGRAERLAAQVDVRERGARGHVPEAHGARRAGRKQPAERRRGPAHVRVIARSARLVPRNTHDAFCASAHVNTNRLIIPIGDLRGNFRSVHT